MSDEEQGYQLQVDAAFEDGVYEINMGLPEAFLVEVHIGEHARGMVDQIAALFPAALEKAFEALDQAREEQEDAAQD